MADLRSTATPIGEQDPPEHKNKWGRLGTNRRKERAVAVALWLGRALVAFVTFPFFVALFWIVCGLALLFATLYTNVLTPNPTDLFQVGVEVYKNIGVALILFGIFNVMIDTRDWRKYFEQRLRSIVIEQSYLNSLDQKVLIDIHTRLLKARLKDQQLDREGTFLNHFNNELVELLSKPYREHVHSHLIVKDVDDGQRLFVIDRVTYICRRMGSNIQQSIPWSTAALDVDKIAMRVRYPDGHPKVGVCESVYNSPSTGEPRDKTTFDVDISKFATVDGLWVEIEATYRVNRDGVHDWTVPTLTHGFSLTIAAPPEYEFDFSAFVRTPSMGIAEQQDGSLLFKYPSWMLPNEGVAWSYQRKQGPTFDEGAEGVSETAHPAR